MPMVKLSDADALNLLRAKVAELQAENAVLRRQTVRVPMLSAAQADWADQKRVNTNSGERYLEQKEWLDSLSSRHPLHRIGNAVTNMHSDDNRKPLTATEIMEARDRAENAERARLRHTVGAWYPPERDPAMFPGPVEWVPAGQPVAELPEEKPKPIDEVHGRVNDVIQDLLSHRVTDKGVRRALGDALDIANKGPKPAPRFVTTDGARGIRMPHSLGG